MHSYTLLQFGKTNIVMITILPKLIIYRCNALPIRVTVVYFVELIKFTVKFI